MARISKLISVNGSSLPIWRMLAVSLLVGLIVYAIHWSWAMKFAPQEGYVFERLPVSEGTYHLPVLSKSNGKPSRVRDIPLYCDGIDFFSQSSGNCVYRDLNLRNIKATRALIPTATGSRPVVVRLSDNTKDYINLDDATIRSIWIKNTRSSCIFSALILGFASIFIIQLICVLHKRK